MVDLPDQAIEMFNNESCDKEKPLVWIATMGKERNPHLAPVCFTKVLDKDKILVAINFATQTMQNIKSYFKVAVGIAVHYEGYLVKGTGSIINNGSEFEQVQKMVKIRFGDKIKPQAALLIDVEEVYSLKPGPGSKKIQ
jgi:predicted pyridoxine 5'-phosphate oxidase superfamily flavin-nucleotide-binding protein